MTTSIELTEEQLTELKAYTNQTDDRAAVQSAMMEFLRLARRLRLKATSGQVEMENNWQEIESAELKDGDDGPATRAH